MKPLSNSAICPKCGGGHKTKPYCLYENGWHCFACGYSKSGDRSFKPRLYQQYKGVDLPENCTTDINKYPLDILLWLYMYNLTNDDIREYLIILSQLDNNLIFLNIDNSEIKGYQKRDIINRAFVTYGLKASQLLTSLVYYDKIVIVEDYISAIRLHKNGYNVLCLWGTKLIYKDLLNYIKNFNIIIVWLDNDTKKTTNSGQEAAKSIIEQGNNIINKKYGFSNKKLINVVTEKDPKCYTNSEIKEILKGY